MSFEVRKRINETTESLIRRFMKKTKKEKIREEITERAFYKKRSLKKREKEFKRQAQIKKLRLKEQMIEKYEQ